jgi:multidrug resistance efflux pump
VPPFSGPGDDEDAGNPTAYLLVLAPIHDDQRIAGVVEIFQRPNTGPASQRGYLRFLSEMCVFVGDYLKGRRLRQLNDWQSLFSKVDRFSRTVHEGLDPRATAYTIANEGRRLIGCDRVSVALRKGTRCVVEAVSGQDTMDTRASSVLLLSKLATAVMRSGDPLWYTGDTRDLPPQIEGAIHDYVDETHTKSVAVIPLRRPMEYVPDGDEAKRKQAEEEEGEVIGTLIVEQIEDNRPPEAFSQSVELVAEHSSRALSNAMDHNNLFLMPVWRAIGKATWVLKARTLPKTLAVLAAVVALIAWLVLWPADLNMKATGKLLPVNRKDVFNLEDGTVMHVLVEHGAHVTEGEKLAELRSSELGLQRSSIVGQLEAVTQQIETVRRDIYEVTKSVRTGQDTTLAQRNQLSSKLLELQTEQQSLTEQLALIDKRIANLDVLSPLKGEIITWDVKKLLERRPVSKGQVLMTVADPDSEWELELFVPENKIGHVLDNRPADGTWPVEFHLKSDPGTKLKGKVREIHEMAQLHEEYGHSVRVLVDLDKQELLQSGSELVGRTPDGQLRAKPGTEVTALIYCGPCSIGYKFFHELFEFVQAKLFF